MIFFCLFWLAVIATNKEKQVKEKGKWNKEEKKKINEISGDKWNTTKSISNLQSQRTVICYYYYWPDWLLLPSFFIWGCWEGGGRLGFNGENWDGEERGIDRFGLGFRGGALARGVVAAVAGWAWPGLDCCWTVRCCVCVVLRAGKSSLDDRGGGGGAAADSVSSVTTAADVAAAAAAAGVAAEEAAASSPSTSSSGHNSIDFSSVNLALCDRSRK